MATGKKVRFVNRARPKSAKAARKRSKVARKSLAVRAVKKKPKKPASKQRRNALAKQRATSKQITPNETIVIDTIEEPIPGVMVVTETEYRR